MNQFKGKRALVIFPGNALNPTTGAESRFLALINLLSSMNIQIDYLEVQQNANFNFTRNKQITNGIRSHIVSIPKSKQFNFPFWIKFRNKFLPVKLPVIHHASLTKVVSNILQNIDYCFIPYIHFHQLAELQKKHPSTQFILMVEDIITDNLHQYLSIKPNNLAKLHNEEIKRIRKFPKAIFISKIEHDKFAPFLKQIQSFHLSSFHKAVFQHNQKKLFDIIYVASDNAFNHEAAKWFEINVIPLLSNKITIAVIGKVTKYLNELAQFPNIHLLGVVNELTPYYQQSKLAVCPMFKGTGVKIKTIEAMSFGLPIVGNLKSIDGIPDADDQPCLITDDPKEFANYIVQLLSDSNFYNQVKAKTEAFFIEHFSEFAAKEKLIQILSS